MRKAEFALRPAPHDTILKAFIWLATLCAMRNEPKSENKKEQEALDRQRNLKYMSMIEALMQYPGDLVLDAIRRWPTQNTWFPEASQIMQIVDKETQARKSLVAALQNAPDATPSKKTGRRWHDLTDDEKAAHDKRMAELRKQIAENAE